MNKNNKALEALERLTNYKCSRMSEKIECKEIIKKELKRLETLDSGAFVCIHVNRYDELEKKEQALDIIKEIDKTALLHLFAVCIKDKEKIDFLKEELL